MRVLTLWCVAASVVRVTSDALVEEAAESVPLFNKIFGLTPRQEQQKRNDEQRARDIDREIEQREASVALFKAYGYTDDLYESDEEEAPAVRRARPSGKPRKSLVRLQRTEGLNGELAKVVNRQSGYSVVKLLTAGADGRKRQLRVAAKQLADPLALVLEKGATVRIVNANHGEDNGKLATVIKPAEMTEKGEPRYEIALWNGAALDLHAASPNALVPVREKTGSTVRIEPGQTIALLPKEHGAPARHGRVLAHADVPHSWIVLVDGKQHSIHAKYLYATEAQGVPRPPDGIA